MRERNCALRGIKEDSTVVRFTVLRKVICSCLADLYSWWNKCPLSQCDKI